MQGIAALQWYWIQRPVNFVVKVMLPEQIVNRKTTVDFSYLLRLFDIRFLGPCCRLKTLRLDHFSFAEYWMFATSF